MKTEKDKDKHVTFRAPEDVINAVKAYCDEHDETPSQFWRKAAKLRLKKLESKKEEEDDPLAHFKEPARGGAGVSGLRLRR
jgi:hypothetical protein